MTSSPGSDRGWRIGCWLIIASAAVLSAAQWYALPYFLDSWFHLSVIDGFREAGGPVLRAFWESAPEGRPHLYPPLFHLLWLPARLAGVPPLVVARLWSVTALPLLLLAARAVFLRLAGPRAAFLALFSLATPYLSFLAAVNNVPATYALAAGLGLALAVERDRPAAAGIFLGAAFWLHAGIPWLLLAGLAAYAAWEPSKRRAAAAAASIGIALAAPWIAHVALNLHGVQFHHRGEDRFLDTPVLFLLLGLAGWVAAARRGGHARFLAALAVGFLPMAFAYRFRYFSAQGLFPWLLLAGVALDRLAEKIPPRLFYGLLCAIALACPGLHWSLTDMKAGQRYARFSLGDSTWVALARGAPLADRITAKPIYLERHVETLAQLVRAATRPDDLIYCNYAYVAGMITSLTGRAATTQMLRELAERPLSEQIRNARLVVWIKEPSGGPGPGLTAAAARHTLKPVGETEIALLLENPAAAARRRLSSPVISWWAALGLVAAAGIAATKGLGG